MSSEGAKGGLDQSRVCEVRPAFQNGSRCMVLEADGKRDRQLWWPRVLAARFDLACVVAKLNCPAQSRMS